MYCYQLVYMAGGSGADLILAAKNIFGNRSKGHTQQNKIIWNGCGQIVIPGGARDADDKSNILAAQREYREETGVDFHDPAVRTTMQCIGEPFDKEFEPGDDGFCCVYQMVSNQSPILAVIEQNIRSGTPADDELHDCGKVRASSATELFGPPILRGWRLDQYQLLTAAEKREADRKMLKPWDWFVASVTYLVGHSDPTAA